jgi:hypothetical protein
LLLAALKKGRYLPFFNAAKEVFWGIWCSFFYH